jgi:putative alpha-1,2-mannosidase
VVLADAYLKNATDGVDWATAYQAVISDAEDEPLNWGVEGRGGLDSWKALGFIPTDDLDLKGTGLRTRSISRTVEYAYNDFCIAEMSTGLGSVEDYQKYAQRSRNWKNMFKENEPSAINGSDTGFVGFLQPRFLNMTWGVSICSSSPCK